jgi:hypothetical protein
VCSLSFSLCRGCCAPCTKRERVSRSRVHSIFQAQVTASRVHSIIHTNLQRVCIIYICIYERERAREIASTFLISFQQPPCDVHRRQEHWFIALEEPETTGETSDPSYATIATTISKLSKTDAAVFSIKQSPSLRCAGVF